MVVVEALDALARRRVTKACATEAIGFVGAIGERLAARIDAGFVGATRVLCVALRSADPRRPAVRLRWTRVVGLAEIAARRGRRPADPARGAVGIVDTLFRWRLACRRFARADHLAVTVVLGVAAVFNTVAHQASGIRRAVRVVGALSCCAAAVDADHFERTRRGRFTFDTTASAFGTDQPGSRRAVDLFGTRVAGVGLGPR